MRSLEEILKIKRAAELISAIRRKIFSANSKSLINGSVVESNISDDINNLKAALLEGGFKEEASFNKEELIQKIICPAFRLQVRP